MGLSERVEERVRRRLFQNVSVLFLFVSSSFSLCSKVETRPGGGFWDVSIGFSGTILRTKRHVCRSKRQEKTEGSRDKINKEINTPVAIQ